MDWLAGTEEVLELAQSESGRFSVQGLVDCEREIITAAARRLGDQRAVVDQRTIERGLDARAVVLTAEQREAVTSVASSDNAVDLIEALAGTGKTTSAGALAEVYRAAGWQVIGIAPTGRAVRELRERAGIARVRTLAGVLADDRRFGGGFDRRQRTLVVLDEAGMAATREVARLLELTARAPVKVVAIGDPGQLPSVQAGGWLGSLSRRQKAVRLSTVMRQRDARERLRGGRPGGYVEQQLLEGHLRVMSAADAEQDALSAWRERQQQHGLREAVLITRNNQHASGSTTRSESSAAPARRAPVVR